jgi:lactoylglutathione lyase
MNLELRNTRLLVFNYEECFHFYRDILGFEVIYGDAQDEEADLKLGEMRLGLIKRQSMAALIGTKNIHPENIINSDKIALIFTSSDLDESYQQLKAKGVKFVTEPMYRSDWQIKTVYLRDPDDNLIGIYQLVV